jgi:signal transduction histidine kinase
VTAVVGGSFAEIADLRRYLSDLITLTAIPAAWTGRDATGVVVTLLDALIGTLHLDFAAARLDESVAGAMPDVVRLPRGRDSDAELECMSRAFAPSISSHDVNGPAGLGRVPNPAGPGDITTSRLRLGLRDDVGVLLVGSTRPDFPNERERLLLHVASNQGAMGLQEVRRLREQERSNQLRADARELEARFGAMLDERTRIAREMHDTLLQGFTGVALHLTAVARRASDAPQVQAALEDVIALAQRTLVDARRAVWGLRPLLLADDDLSTALRRLANDACHAAGLECSYEVVGPPQALVRDTESVIVRVAQEALANVVKHARARSVRVSVAFDAHELCLTISDDGGGFVVDPTFRAFGGHLGLVGMRERAIEVRGSLHVRSAAGAGTDVVLRIPYDGAEARNPSQAAVRASV